MSFLGTPLSVKQTLTIGHTLLHLEVPNVAIERIFPTWCQVQQVPGTLTEVRSRTPPSKSKRTSSKVLTSLGLWITDLAVWRSIAWEWLVQTLIDVWLGWKVQAAGLRLESTRVGRPWSLVVLQMEVWYFALHFWHCDEDLLVRETWPWRKQLKHIPLLFKMLQQASTATTMVQLEDWCACR